MLPMMVVTLMLAVISIGANMMIPRSVATQAALAASKSAINLVLYQNALMTYKATNPGFSGTVSSASLTFPKGVTGTTGWSNIISANVLYVYSSGTLTPSDMNAIMALNVDATSLGRVKAVSVGILVTGSSITIPTSIPVGATFSWNQ
jgi:hypothetical protein